ncbi:MAG: NADH-quinone oxidoreductase subunit K [Pseudomonadota bacterium]
MTPFTLYALTGIGLFVLGLYSLIVQAHLIRKVIALNIMGSGVFLVLVGLGGPTSNTMPDPVPQAMVLTGIVVAIAATALALTLILRIQAETGRTDLAEHSSQH